MGTCCSAHLATKIRNYASNAQNGAVTVVVLENPEVHWAKIDGQNAEVLSRACDYCKAPAEFAVSYYTKRS
jgi:hypothetical protein